MIDDGATPAPRRAGINCDEAIELIPALALGAIEPAERILLQAHCDTCVICAGELTSSSNAVSLLGLTAPLVDAPARAKTALFQRIATPELVTAPAIADDLFGMPLVASPGDKRRRTPSESAKVFEARFAPGSVTSPISRWSGRVSKIAVAPLALALVLVSVYAMQTRGDLHDLQATNASLTSASLLSSGTSGEQEVADLNAPSAANTAVADTGNLVAQPVLYTFSASGGSQTGSARAVSPVDSTCKMAGDGTGKYQLQVYGVDLPGSANKAAVYLQTANGMRTYLTSVTLDASGFGEANFKLDTPIASDSTLLIGPAGGSSAGAQPMNGAVTFLLTSGNTDVPGLGSS